MGVELWEARADAAKVVAEDGSTMLDHLTLHAKGMVIDRRLVIAGSLNLDPRSIDINSELALFLDSPELGERMASTALDAIPNGAYRLKLDDRGRITWHATIDGEQVVETSEPQASWWRRVSAWFQKIAPEDQL
jgi:putative cardiolipin synthase